MTINIIIIFVNIYIFYLLVKKSLFINLKIIIYIYKFKKKITINDY